MRRSEIGWTIEIELPFRTFNFDPNGKAWGINFQRMVQRKNEQTLWTGWRLNQGMRIQYTGLLLGIDNVTQGHGLEIRPYGVASALAEPGRGRPKTIGDANAGVDMFYSVTPALRANLTVNTDFAQTEVDQRQVNLTQYSLFFPEKRTFFLEGASYFDFASFSQGQGGGNNNNVNVVPFFTRRIGLDANGDPQKIDVGAKLTGQVGGRTWRCCRFGPRAKGRRAGRRLHGVSRAAAHAAPVVCRGALYAARRAHARRAAARPAARHVRSAEHHRPGLPRRDHDVPPQPEPRDERLLPEHDQPAQHGEERGVGRQRRLSERSLHRPPAVQRGAGQLRARRRLHAAQRLPALRAAARFQPRPKRVGGRARGGVQQYQFGVVGDVQLTTAGNDWLLRRWDVTAFQANFQSQDQIQVHVIPAYEQLDRNFNISRGITLPRGTDYSYSRYRVVFGTAQRRKFAATTTVETGSFYSGDRDQLILDTAFRPRTGVVVYLYGEWNKVTLPQGHFSTRLYRTILDTQFNPWVQLSNNIQYDSVSAVMGWQSRFRWILRPGNDLYVVYTHNWLDDPIQTRFITQDRRMASKMLYTYRF